MSMILRTLLAIVAIILLEMGADWVFAEGEGGDRLALSIAPDVLEADGDAYVAVYVQLVDSAGTAKLMATGLEVTLTSSNPFVATVPAKVRIPAGRSYVAVPLTTTTTPGTAMISANAVGHAQSVARVETHASSRDMGPYSIELHAAPPTMIAGSRPAGRLSVTLMGPGGVLYTAPEDLAVTLRSSNPEAVRVQDAVTVPKGAAYALVDLEPLSPGAATLSAVSPGFTSQFIGVRTIEAGGTPDALRLYLAPPILGPRSEIFPGVIIQAVDGNQTPTYFQCGEARLVSSLPDTVSVVSTIQLPCGDRPQYVTGTLRTGDRAGVATITITASGLVPVAGDITVQSNTPAALKAYTAPSQLIAAEPTAGYVVIQVTDESGLPLTSHGGIAISIVGADGDTVPSRAFIPPGRSFVRLDLRGPGSGRELDLWLAAEGLEPANLPVSTMELPVTVDVALSGTRFLPGHRVNVLVRAESLGLPLEDASIEWNGRLGVLEETASATDGRGEGYGTFVTATPGDGLIEVTVKKPGYRAGARAVPVPIVSREETTAPPAPRLLGVPVWLLFVAVMALIAFHLFRPVHRLRNAGNEPVT